MLSINSDIAIMMHLTLMCLIINLIRSTFSSGQIILVALIKLIENLVACTKMTKLFWIGHDLLLPHVIWFGRSSWRQIARIRLEVHCSVKGSVVAVESHFLFSLLFLTGG
jgi:hypothetical protein